MLYEVITLVERLAVEPLHGEGAAGQPADLQHGLGPHIVPAQQQAPLGLLQQYHPLIPGKGKVQPERISYNFV